MLIAISTWGSAGSTRKLLGRRRRDWWWPATKILTLALRAWSWTHLPFQDRPYLRSYRYVPPKHGRPVPETFRPRSYKVLNYGGNCGCPSREVVWRAFTPSSLPRIRKGVFGLSESPRMWYDRLSNVLLGEVFNIDNKVYRLRPSPLDPCVLMLLENGEAGEPSAYLAIHVDDILVVAPPLVNENLRKRIGALFPVDDWIIDSFEYTGSFIRNDKDGVFINQANFVEGRLFRVDVPRQQPGYEPATYEQEVDKPIADRGFELARESEPAGPSVRRRALPAVATRTTSPQDVRFVNGLTSRAEEHKDQGIYLRNIDLDKAIFVAFHDAAWANAELEDAEEDFKLTPEEIEAKTYNDLYTDLRPRKAKRSGIESSVPDRPPSDDV